MEISASCRGGAGVPQRFHIGAMRINQCVANPAVAPYQYIQPAAATGVTSLGALALQRRHRHRVQFAIGDVALTPELYPRGHES